MERNAFAAGLRAMSGRPKGPDRSMETETARRNWILAEGSRLLVLMNELGRIAVSSPGETIERIAGTRAGKLHENRSQTFRRRAEALDRGHGSATRISDPTPLGSAALEGQERSDEDAEQGEAELVVPGERVTKAMRQSQNPLPHG